MCLPLVGHVLAVEGEMAVVELHGDAGTARVSTVLYPEIGEGQHVLVDRGMVIELIDAQQADMLLAFYAELAGMDGGLEESDAQETPAGELTVVGGAGYD